MAYWPPVKTMAAPVKTQITTYRQCQSWNQSTRIDTHFQSVAAKLTHHEKAVRWVCVRRLKQSFRQETKGKDYSWAKLTFLSSEFYVRYVSRLSQGHPPYQDPQRFRQSYYRIDAKWAIITITWAHWPKSANSSSFQTAGSRFGTLLYLNSVIKSSPPPRYPSIEPTQKEQSISKFPSHLESLSTKWKTLHSTTKMMPKLSPPDQALWVIVTLTIIM